MDAGVRETVAHYELSYTIYSTSYIRLLVLRFVRIHLRELELLLAAELRWPDSHGSKLVFIYTSHMCKMKPRLFDKESPALLSEFNEACTVTVTVKRPRDPSPCTFLTLWLLVEMLSVFWFYMQTAEAKS